MSVDAKKNVKKRYAINFHYYIAFLQIKQLNYL
jgi:hypothetical protein